MGLDHKAIIQKVDVLFTSHPKVSLRIVAEKLETTEQIIEEALKEIEGMSFKEYQKNKRLEEAFKQLGKHSPAANGPYEQMRSRRRLSIPKAMVRYRLYRLWIRRSNISDRCPLVDFSRGGLAFLADKSFEPQSRLSLLLKFPEEKTIRLEGRVVYAIATGIAGYSYRIGIQYLPFAKRRGCNSLEALDVLIKLEKTYGSQDV